MRLRDFNRKGGRFYLENTNVKNKKILYYGMVLILFYQFIVNNEVFNEGVKFIMSVFSPIIIGFIIAYLLEPLIKLIETRYKINRKLGILGIYLLLIILISVSISSIIPSLTSSISELIQEMPNYSRQIIAFSQNIFTQYPILNEFGVEEKIIEFFNENSGKSLDAINYILKFLVNNSMSISGKTLNFFMGMTIAYYFLADKSKFINNTKKIMAKLFTKRNYEDSLIWIKKSNDIFLNYLLGKIVDSVIIGIIAFIMFKVANIQYAMLFAVITAITNMIPYFGPIIGAVPVVLITLFYSPTQALIAAIMMIVLQQFDGIWLGPKILGDKVGISPFWIIVSVLIGGKLMGVVGMFLSVPVAAVFIGMINDYAGIEPEIKTVKKKFINKKKK